MCCLSYIHFVRGSLNSGKHGKQISEGRRHTQIHVGWALIIWHHPCTLKGEENLKCQETVRLNSLKHNNSYSFALIFMIFAFCSQSVFVCLTQFSQQRVTILQNRISVINFATEMQCVVCEVGTDYLNIIQIPQVSKTQKVRNKLVSVFKTLTSRGFLMGQSPKIYKTIISPLFSVSLYNLKIQNHLHTV